MYLIGHLNACGQVRSRLRFSIVIKVHCFRELQLVVLRFSQILIDFHPKKAIEFTATAAVFKWELLQHIHVTKVSKLFWRCRFFTLETLQYAIVSCYPCNIKDKVWIRAKTSSHRSVSHPSAKNSYTNFGLILTQLTIWVRQTLPKMEPEFLA